MSAIIQAGSRTATQIPAGNQTAPRILGTEDAAHERGYLQALKDLRVYHQQVIDDGAGFEDAKGHRESIRFLDGLIATKERRLGKEP